MGYRGVVIGATGAVGGALVRELLDAPECFEITALTRRPVDLFPSHAFRAKLRVAVIDLEDLEAATMQAAREYELAFCTMGIGQPRRVSFEEFWRVDVEYAGAFARGAARAGVHHISLLSSVGANLKSRNPYLRVKGAAEKVVTDAAIARTSLFRPSLLVTREMRYGWQDRVTRALFPLVAPLLPSRFHQIRVEDLARAMYLNAEQPRGPDVEILYYRDFMALLGST